MKSKYDKYWGNYNNVNALLFIVVLLDPCHKERFLKYCFDMLYGESVSKDVVVHVKVTLQNLYRCYSNLWNWSSKENMDNLEYGNDMKVDIEVDPNTLFTSRYMRVVRETNGIECKTKMDRYLIEAYEDLKNLNFDILG